MKKNRRTYRIVLFNFLFSPFIFSQSYQQKVSYETYQTTFYDYGLGVDFNSISAHEITLNNTVEMKDAHTEFITSDGEYVHEIEHKFNTEYPSWMNMPVKTMINENGVISYDGNGNELVSFPNASTKEKSNESRELMGTPDFSPLPQNKSLQMILKAMEIDISSVKENEEGMIILKSGNHETQINLEQKYWSDVEYDSLNNEVYRFDKTFILDEEGNQLPYQTAEVSYKTTENGIKYKKITFTAYSNCLKQKSDLAVGLNKVVIPDFLIYPNPAKNTLFLDIPSSLLVNESLAQVSIYNVFGNEVLNLIVQPQGKPVEIDVNLLSAGVYTVKVVMNESSKTMKIVKQ